jgi:hypothetical protein
LIVGQEHSILASSVLLEIGTDGIERGREGCRCGQIDSLFIWQQAGVLQKKGFGPVDRRYLHFGKTEIQKGRLNPRAVVFKIRDIEITKLPFLNM